MQTNMVNNGGRAPNEAALDRVYLVKDNENAAMRGEAMSGTVASYASLTEAPKTDMPIRHAKAHRG